MTRCRPSLFWALVTLLLCIGCLEEPDGQTARSEASDRSEYPGFDVYGTEEDSMIAPLQFVNVDGSAFGLDQIFGDDTNRLLLLTTSAGWCTACIEEQPTLQALHEEFGERGLHIMVTLFQTRNYEPADYRLAARWKRQYELDFTVVADPEFVTQRYYPDGDASVTPIVLLVDVDTMQIISVQTGFSESAVRGIISSRL